MAQRISRRNFLGLSAGLAISSTALPSLAPFRFTTDDFELKQITIIAPHLGASFNHYRIGFLTDTHLGYCVPLEWIERTVGMVRQAGVDLLLLGGDYIWVPNSLIPRSFGELREMRYHGLGFSELVDKIYLDLAQSFASLPTRDGKFAVLGNHDRWVSPKTCITKLERENISVLNNAKHTIQRGNDRLTIIGVDDYWNGIPKMPALDNPRRANDFRLLLCHNPDFASRRLASDDYTWRATEFDLALCGHTHGGQIRLPLVGAVSYNIQDRGLGDGLAQRDRAQVYTSRGIGVVEVPYRINCRPEVTIIELRTA